MLKMTLDIRRFELAAIVCLAGSSLCLFAAEGSADPGRVTVAGVERSLIEGRYDAAVSGAGKLIDSHSSQQDELYYFKGIGQMKLSRFGDARESFGKVISKYSGSAMAFDAYVGIADAYFLESNYSSAVTSYNDVLSRFPNSKNIAVVYYRLGSSCLKSGSADKAREYFDKVRRLAPLSFEARMIPGSDRENSAVIKAGNNKAAMDSPGADYFSVQAGSFRNRKNAEKFAAKLSASGFDSYVESYGGSNGTLYRVKVGRCATRDEAAKLGKRLKKQGYSTKMCNKDVCQ